jgi:hypothetical protein
MPGDPESVSLFFPVYKDERTVRAVTQKARLLLASLGCAYEIVIVDDGSPDRSGAIADELAREHPRCAWSTTRGISATARPSARASRRSRCAVVCMTDGDDEYEIEDFRKLLKLRQHYDLIITFRYRKVLLEHAHLRLVGLQRAAALLLPHSVSADVSTGLRLVRRAVLQDVALESTEPVRRRRAGDQGHAQGLPGRRGRHPDLPAQLRLGQLDLAPEHPRTIRTCGASTVACSRTSTTCRAAAAGAEAGQPSFVSLKKRRKGFSRV